MSNEEKILELLGQVLDHQSKTDAAIQQMRQDQAQMRQDQAQMRQDQAQMREEMNERFDALEANMKFAWQDIALMERRIKQHEKEFHNAG